MTEQTTALTVLERARKTLVIKLTEDDLKALAAKTTDITAITNADGRQQVHAARMALKNERIDIQKRSKEARDDATKFSKAVIAEENRLIGLISPEEERLQKLQDAWDEAIESEKQAKIAAEQKRVVDLQERVAELRGNQLLSAASDPDLIAEHIEDIEKSVVDESFQEFQELAAEAKAAGVARLNELHVAAVARVAEEARLKGEREELTKLRAEQAKRDAEDRARLAEEERKARLEREAEAARQAAELKAAREKQATEAAEERRRIAEEEAAAKAVRDAEARELAQERAEFDRQQAEARRVREEEERAERERARLASIKKPSDDELLQVLADHYSVPVNKVVEWLLAVDFSSMEAA